MWAPPADLTAITVALSYVDFGTRKANSASHVVATLKAAPSPRFHAFGAEDGSFIAS